MTFLRGRLIDIESLKIDCLRFVVCLLLAPAFQGSFFFSFLFLLQWQFTVLINQTRLAVHAVKQSIYSSMSMERLFEVNLRDTPPKRPGSKVIKTFHNRNLSLGNISYIVCPGLAFPALSNVCEEVSSYPKT